MTRRSVVTVLVAAGLLGANAGALYTLSQHVRTVTVTRTEPAKIIHVRDKARVVYRTVPGPVRTVYRNGYPYISQDPAWNCAGSLYNAYIRLANGGPAGDSGLWSEVCPGVPQPAN